MTYRLGDLLDETFPYIGVHELRQIPFTVMKAMHTIPEHYLSALANSQQLLEVNARLLSRVKR